MNNEIMNNEWWIMNNEWWMMTDEWWAGKNRMHDGCALLSYRFSHGIKTLLNVFLIWYGWAWWRCTNCKQRCQLSETTSRRIHSFFVLIKQHDMILYLHGGSMCARYAWDIVESSGKTSGNRCIDCWRSRRQRRWPVNAPRQGSALP